MPRVLHVNTGIRELHELAVDLEAMRRELVGVNDRLEQKIKEKEISEARRDELQKQLRHRQRLETVGTLAGGIAHEFNNVLVPIILFTEAAMQDLPPGSTSRADLERVLAAARRAKNVVQKILTFSHVLGDAALAPTDLRTVVSESIVLFSALAPASIEIRTEIAEKLPLVRADATLAGDIVMNLCTNAYQAMQGSKGRHHDRLACDAGRPGAARAWSSGFPIPGKGWIRPPSSASSNLSSRPAPSVRARASGLSVVHGIVEIFGASITVESAPGAGTTFRIFFAVEGCRIRSIEAHAHHPGDR